MTFCYVDQSCSVHLMHVQFRADLHQSGILEFAAAVKLSFNLISLNDSPKQIITAN